MKTDSKTTSDWALIDVSRERNIWTTSNFKLAKDASKMKQSMEYISTGKKFGTFTFIKIQYTVFHKTFDHAIYTKKHK